ncbi:MAG TPA: hypothetical protein DEA94_01630 [Rhodobacteraceae bacterium]|nr:hypothetical protein [Paracoccaceae bacterium]
MRLRCRAGASWCPARHCGLHPRLSLPGEPCRGQDRGDVDPVQFEHLAEILPYRASYAIYVRCGAVQAVPAVGEVPSILLRRKLAVRGFGVDHCIKVAEVTEGRTLSATIEGIFQQFSSFIHSYPQC